MSTPSDRTSEEAHRDAKQINSRNDPYEQLNVVANTSPEKTMATRGEVVWAPDPFSSGSGNPRPWLVVSVDKLPYPNEESIAVAFTTQSHHPGSFPVPSEAWVRGEPNTESHVLPWSVATLKDDVHIAGVQGAVTDGFVDQVTAGLISSLDSSSEGQN